VLEEADLREFVLTEYPRVVAAVALVSGSESAAEDAVQEALLRAWERSRRGYEIGSVTGWVTTVALNLSRSGLRRIIAERKARHRLGVKAADAPSADRLDVARAVSLLPRRQREVVVLRYLLDMTTNEAAETMRVSEGTVKSQLARARTALATTLHVDEEATSNHAEA
jgi:RNA polymerase sigma factor (sigma-70 family)